MPSIVGVMIVIAAAVVLGRQSVTALPTFDTVVRLETTSEDSANVSPGDLDGDGDRDLDVLTSNDTPDRKLVYLNDGTGRLSVAGTWGVGTWSTRNAAIADVNGDGRPDVVAANRPGPSFVCLNEGGGRFATDCIPIPAASATSIVPADFDKDGFVDLAVPSRDVGQSHVYFNDGKAGFARQMPFGSGRRFDEVRFGDRQGSAYGFALGDVNGDGGADIALARSGAPNVLYLAK